MPFKVVRNDITKTNAQAIVNAANVNLQMGGGVCGAIFTAAGAEKLQEECNLLKPCMVGKSVITKGYKLPAEYIIHTVGPIWRGGDHKEAKLLRSAYESALNLALKNKIKSIAFPLISAGIYGYPKAQAFNIAISVIQTFLLENEMDISLVLYEKEAVYLSEKLFPKIEQYIDDHYIQKTRSRTLEVYELQDDYLELAPKMEESSLSEEVYRPKIHYSKVPSLKKRSLEDVVDQMEETFSQRLLGLIDEKGMTDVETYKAADVDRRLFSKIRGNDQYTPSKIKAVSFVIALQLNLDETMDLLGRAGYALSPSSKFDLIIRFFIEEANYDMYEINQALEEFGEKLLSE